MFILQNDGSSISRVMRTVWYSAHACQWDHENSENTLKNCLNLKCQQHLKEREFDGDELGSLAKKFCFSHIQFTLARQHILPQNNWDWVIKQYYLTMPPLPTVPPSYVQGISEKLA